MNKLLLICENKEFRYILDDLKQCCNFSSDVRSGIKYNFVTEFEFNSGASMDIKYPSDVTKEVVEKYDKIFISCYIPDELIDVIMQKRGRTVWI